MFAFIVVYSPTGSTAYEREMSIPPSVALLDLYLYPLIVKPSGIPGKEPGDYVL